MLGRPEKSTCAMWVVWPATMHATKSRDEKGEKRGKRKRKGKEDTSDGKEEAPRPEKAPWLRNPKPQEGPRVTADASPPQEGKEQPRQPNQEMSNNRITMARRGRAKNKAKEGTYKQHKKCSAYKFCLPAEYN